VCRRLDGPHSPSGRFGEEKKFINSIACIVFLSYIILLYGREHSNLQANKAILLHSLHVANTAIMLYLFGDCYFDIGKILPLPGIKLLPSSPYPSLYRLSNLYYYYYYYYYYYLFIIIYYCIWTRCLATTAKETGHNSSC
jgi:hypothetical protein